MSAGYVEIEVPFSAGVTRQHGLFHGGVMGVIGDSACGYAARTENPGVGGSIPSLPTSFFGIWRTAFRTVTELPLPTILSVGCAALLGESSSYLYPTPGGTGPV